MVLLCLWLAILAGLALLVAPTPVSAQTPNQAAGYQADEADWPPGYPSLDAPWTTGKTKAQTRKPAEPPAPATSKPPAVAAETGTPSPAAMGPEAIARPKTRRNEVSFSGDYFLGQGNVTMPFGFSLGQTLGFENITPTVAKPDRTSDYYGATISYSFNQKFFIDLAYSHGSSSGDVDVQLGAAPTDLLPSAFTIKDDWYQAYLRYRFPWFRASKFSGYLRLGFSYVKADLTDTTVIPALGLYEQQDSTEDLLGNLGFGLGYRLYRSPAEHLRIDLQVEGEGFFGRRTQKSLETLPEDFGLTFSTASIDNDLYGGIGRATVRFEYRFGRSAAFRLFADGGVQARFTYVNYPRGLGSFDELLWGPYIKLGARYSF